jgi:hypothetical protein
MGELDVRMVAELFGGRPAGAAMAKAWDGGVYYAAQSKKAKTPAQQGSTASVAIFYLSQWKTEQAAETFASLYGGSLNKKYSTVTQDSDDSNGQEQIYNTEEGPVLIARTGKQLFISETFDLPLARKLQLLLRSVQNNDEEQVDVLLHMPASPGHELVSPLSGWISHCGMMRAALVH